MTPRLAFGSLGVNGPPLRGSGARLQSRCVKIEVRDGARRGDVEAWLREPGQGEVVKDNRVRSVHRWKGLYVKRFKNVGFVQRVRSWVNDRAAHEFRMLEGLKARGIAAPEPVAWARDGASTYLFTREIEGAEVLRSMTLTRALLRDLAALVRAMHEAGFRDDDFHVGNVLVVGGKLHLVDVHRAKFVGGLTEAERTRSVAFLVLSFYVNVTLTEAHRFLHACEVNPSAAWREFRVARERYYLDRQSRTRKTGSDFEGVDGMVLRRPFTAEEAKRIFEAAPVRVVKETPRRRLWLADKETFVKEGAPALWENGFGVETRGIPTPRLLAVSGDRVAGRWIEGALPLWEYLKAQGVSRDLIWRLALLVRRMHWRGVFHRDLKANNVLARGDDLWVIDLDRVDFMREVPRPDRVLNLAQLNAAVGAPATRTDRLRFFLAYAGRNRQMRLEWKTWVREVMEITVARKHVWPGKLEAKS